MASLTTGRRGWARGIPSAESWGAGHTGCLVKPLTERTQPPALTPAGLSREGAETDPQAPAPECPTALGLSWALAQLRHPVKPRQCAVGADSPPGARAEMQHHLTPFSHPIPGPLAGHWSRPRPSHHGPALSLRASLGDTSSLVSRFLPSPRLSPVLYQTLSLSCSKASRDLTQHAMLTAHEAQVPRPSAARHPCLGLSCSRAQPGFHTYE